MQVCDVSNVFVLHLHHSHCWFYRRNAGGCVIKETSQILKEAQCCAQQELATQTEDTDSEEDGPGIYDEELEYQESNKYQDDAKNEDGNYVTGRSGAAEEDENMQGGGSRQFVL